MKKFLSLLLLLSTGLCYAQETITISGIVADSTHRLPVPSATVTISAPSGNFTKSLLTDTSGHFSFDLLPKSSYRLTFSSIGYRTKAIQVSKDSLSIDKRLDVGTIYLSDMQQNLDEVVITARKARITQEIDRLVYDVQGDADSKSLSLLEFMTRVPLLSVDGEENVRLKGSGNYRIFVNGRPSSLFAHNAKEALKAMPANSVKKIEVITTPPSKYDAEGLAGIINLVLNKRLVDGYNASLGVSFNNTVGTGQDLTLTGKKGKIGVTARAYLFQDFRRHLHSEIQRETKKPYYSLLDQQGTYSFIGSYFTENLELSYDIDSLNLLTTSVNFTNSNYDDQTMLFSSTKDSQGQAGQSYRSLNINPQKESGLNLDVNYQRGFKNNKDRLLTASYQYQYAPKEQHNELYFTERYNYPLNDYWQENTSNTKEQTFQLDYVEPTGKFIYDLGAKGIFRRNYSDYGEGLFDGNGNSGALQDGDRFNYQQNVYSLYHSWHIKLKPIEVKAGLRLEHTIVNADFISQQTKLQTGYTNLIPVISLQHRLSNGALNLGYSQRISRPGITQLNPFVNRANPEFAVSGNPDLKAVLKNNFELSYGRYGKGNINISSSYSFSNNTIQQVSSFADSVTYTSYENLGKERSLGLNLSVSYPFTKYFSASLNSELTYLWIEGTYNSRFYKNSGMQGYAYANLNYSFADTWRASVSATMVSSNIYLQGSVNGYIHHSYRISKDMLNKKLTIAATISNPFDKYRYVRTKTDTEDFSELRISQRYYRSFSVNLNYNFGNLKSDIRKNKRKIQNDDIR